MMKNKLFLTLFTSAVISSSVFAMKQFEAPSSSDVLVQQPFLSNMQRSMESMVGFFRDNPEACPNVWINSEGQIGIWNGSEAAIPQNAIIIGTKEIKDAIKKIMTTNYPTTQRQFKTLINYLRDQTNLVISRPLPLPHSLFRRTLDYSLIFLTAFILQVIFMGVATYEINGCESFFEHIGETIVEFIIVILASVTAPFYIAYTDFPNPSSLLMIVAIGIGIYRGSRFFHNTHNAQAIAFNRYLENIGPENTQLQQLVQNLIIACQEMD